MTTLRYGSASRAIVTLRGAAVVLTLVAVLVGVLAGCAQSPAPESEAGLMSAGLEALYTRHDAAGAAAQFRKVLTQNPTHYGATYQLAIALDEAGMHDDARPVWEKMLAMAEGANDAETTKTARVHLGQQGLVEDEVTMKAGIAALYTRHEPAEAATEFRKVLAHTPTHYGATYQLAVALDASGKPDEARPLWEKTLQMAQASNDAATAETAEARLQKQP